MRLLGNYFLSFIAPFLIRSLAIVSFTGLLFAQQFPTSVELSKRINQIASNMQIQALTIDPGGNVYVAGTANRGFAAATTRLGPGGATDIFVIKLNPDASQVLYATAIGGTAEETLKAIRADAAGNLYLIGSTLSTNFPFSKAFFENVPSGGLVAKLNPAGTALVYATILGSRISTLTLDLDGTGAAYIGGIANSQDLPTTPGVLRPSPAAGVDPNVFLGYVAKLSADGSTVQLATYFGEDAQWVEGLSVRPNGNVTLLAGGNLVVLNAGLSTQVSSTPSGVRTGTIAFDDSGNIYVSGEPLVGDPTKCSVGANATGCLVIKKFGPGGGAALWSATLPLLSSNNAAPRMGVSAAGRVFVFGQPTSSGFPTLNGTQPCLANIAAPNGSAGQITPGSDGLIGNTGGGVRNDQAMMIVDTAGNTVHSTFFSTAVTRVAVAPTNGRIWAAGSQSIFAEPSGPGTAPAVEGVWSGVLRFNQDTTPTATVAPSCLVHAATFEISPVSPGAIMTIFGSNLGPATGTSFSLDADGKVPASLGGVQVTVDGRPSPVLFVLNRQINFIVPWDTRDDGAVVEVCVSFNSQTTCLDVGTTRAVPGAFPVGPLSAALNQDGSVNSASRPAPGGTSVAVYLTGTGRLSAAMTDGGVGAVPLASVPGDETAYFSSSAAGCTLFGCPNFPDSVNVAVQYSGVAPGLVHGVTQVNLLIPPGIPPSSNTLFIVEFHLPGDDKPVVALVRLAVTN